MNIANALDLIIFFCLGLSIFLGLSRGFIREVLSLSVWFLTIVWVMVFIDRISPMFKSYVADPQMQFVLALIVLFLPAYFMLKIIADLLVRIFLRDGLDSYDHILGLLFGAIRGGIVLSALVLVGQATKIRHYQWWVESYSVQALQHWMEETKDLWPETLKNKVAYQPSKTRRLILQLNTSGHYQAKGYLNDYPVDFLIDTGATVVAIPALFAPQIGLELGAPEKIMTAKGETTMHQTNIEQIRLGNITLHNVEGGIVIGMEDNRVLLGMSFLKRLNMQQQRNMLILEQSSD